MSNIASRVNRLVRKVENRREGGRVGEEAAAVERLVFDFCVVFKTPFEYVNRTH